MKNICVLGSINMDMALFVKRMPETGETLFCDDLKRIPGGKGANQAVAAKRLGANVYMIGKIGQDDNGKMLLNNLINDGIDVSNIYADKEKPTGLAMITVTEKGENSIIVVSGSNMNICCEEVLAAEDKIKYSDIIVSGFEIPVEAAAEAFRIARKHSKMTLLNPSPARAVPDELFGLTDIMVVNENEASLLTGVNVTNIETARKAAFELVKRGVKYVIVTLGKNGTVLSSEKKADIIPAHKVKAVDTTAAGDAFIGAMASRISEKPEHRYDDLKDAVVFANSVSAIVVQRYGAQPSLPYLEEVIEAYRAT